MAFNIVDLVKEQISDQLLGQMGNVLGTDGSKTSIALGGALPGLLSGLTGVAAKPGGADVLYDTVRRQDEGTVGNMGALLGGGDDTSRVIEQGNSTLESLFGSGALGKLGSVLASFAGMSRSGSGSLMGMLAPIVLGAIKRKMTESNLDAGGLASLLGDQRSNIDAAMPQGLAGQLQSEGFFDSIAPGSGATQTRADAAPAEASARAEPAPVASAEPAPRAAAAPDPGAASATPAAHTPAPAPAKSDSSGGGLPGWVLPLAAVVLLALLAWLFLGGDDDEVDEAVTTTEEAVTETATTTEEAADPVAELPEGLGVEEFTDAISDVLGSTAGTLENITDEPSARAALPALKDANTKLGGLNDNVARLPAEAKAPIAAAVTAGLQNLRPLVDRVLELPGAGPVVEPVLGPMMKTLEGLSG